MLDRPRITQRVADLDEFSISDDICDTSAGHCRVLLRHRTDYLDEEQSRRYESAYQLETN